MRKIRAWDSHFGVMRGREELGGLCLDALEASNLEVMMSTGLFDKTGVEIYEGDIFEGLHDFGPAGFGEATGVVSFDAEKGYGWEHWLLSSLVVVGNIYED